jgi:hypothetical protein
MGKETTGQTSQPGTDAKRQHFIKRGVDADRFREIFIFPDRYKGPSDPRLDEQIQKAHDQQSEEKNQVITGGDATEIDTEDTFRRSDAP